MTKNFNFVLDSEMPVIRAFPVKYHKKSKEIIVNTQNYDAVQTKHHVILGFRITKTLFQWDIVLDMKTFNRLCERRIIEVL